MSLVRALLADVRSGAFAERFMRDHDAGHPAFGAWRRAASAHPIEQASATREGAVVVDCDTAECQASERLGAERHLLGARRRRGGDAHLPTRRRLGLHGGRGGVKGPQLKVVDKHLGAGRRVAEVEAQAAEAPMAEVVAAIARGERTGEALGRLQRWLHRPGSGVADNEIAGIIRQHLPASEAVSP